MSAPINRSRSRTSRSPAARRSARPTATAGTCGSTPAPTLLLDHVRVTDGLALRGGGIAMTTGTRVTITRSLIDNNVTTGSTGAPSREGGALIVLGNPQLAANVLQISDSTIADNDSSQGPGIVLRGNSADSAVLDRVTIARNVAGTNSVGAGIGNPGRGERQDRIIDRRLQHRRRHAGAMRCATHEHRREHRHGDVLRLLGARRSVLHRPADQRSVDRGRRRDASLDDPGDEPRRGHRAELQPGRSTRPLAPAGQILRLRGLRVRSGGGHRDYGRPQQPR